MERITTKKRYREIVAEANYIRGLRDSKQAEVLLIYKRIDNRIETESFFARVGVLNKRIERMLKRCECVLNVRTMAYYSGGVESERYRKAHAVVGGILKKVADVSARKDSLVNRNKQLYIENESDKKSALEKYEVMMAHHYSLIKLEASLSSAPKSLRTI